MKVSRGLRGGERDSRSGGSARMAVIGILGAIIGTAVATSASGACEPAGFPVAIDVGHDRDRPGALSARRMPEFEFNLALGCEVLAALLASGFSRSFLIGESGSPIGLRERTALAERAGARVFISLHHDSVLPRYLERWTFEGRMQEHTTHARGFSLFVSAANGFYAASKELARRIGDLATADPDDLVDRLKASLPVPKARVRGWTEAARERTLAGE